LTRAPACSYTTVPMRTGRRLAVTPAFLGVILAAVLAGLPAEGHHAGPALTAAAVPAHHLASGFRNLDPHWGRASAWVRVRHLVGRLGALVLRGDPPVAPLPLTTPDVDGLRHNGHEATVTWVGHSTLLVQLDGVNILTDPHWGARSGPFGGRVGVRRYTPPGIAFEDLPPIDVVLISHDHYDHLDRATVERLARTHRPRFFVPLGLGAWFADLGIPDVVELDWWEAREVSGLRVTCVPAQHFSGRSPWRQNRTLWAGWTVAGRSKRLFFAGDTGYYDVFKEIGARLGPFDVAAIPIGAYLPPAIMRFNHTTPEEALRLFADVRGRRFVAIHWGTFDLAEEPLDEPPKRLRAEAERQGLADDRVWVLKHGETRRW
jgi:N-acyl-phosphatidylethanolamine-hydrolysing phospholipase D